MNRKLSICLFLAVMSGFAAAEDTNAPAPGTQPGQDDSVAARRAQIESWRKQFGGIDHVDSTNTLAIINTNAPGDTNQLSTEERRAIVRAKLEEWHNRQSLAIYTNTLINLSTSNTPGTNIYYP
jgi:hypothetical protein